jgi:hypothetical protein
MKMFWTSAVQYQSLSHKRLYSIWSAASATESFKFYLIYSDLNRHMWLASTLLGNTMIDYAVSLGKFWVCTGPEKSKENLIG